MPTPTLIQCPECQRHIFPNADGCPFCGVDKHRVAKVVVAAAIGVAALTMMGCAYGSPPTDTNQADAVTTE